MSGLTEYDDIADNAMADYYAERPEPDHDHDPTDECPACGRIVCEHQENQ
jgi:hypothetical protein